jgi:hypothetical protein
MSSKSETAAFWIRFAANIGVLISTQSLLILGWQVYGYLRQAVWQPVSAIDALRYLNMNWAIAPTDWLGLYRFLDWMPVTLLLLITGVSLTFVAYSQERWWSLAVNWLIR